MQKINLFRAGLFRAGVSTACLIGCVLLIGCANEPVETASVQTNSTAAVAHAPDFTAANFQSDVLESPQVVLVDCWAAW